MNNFQVKKLLFLIFGVSFFWSINASIAQLRFEYIEDMAVVENEVVLAHPFAGGLNSGQYHTLDLNNDDLLDLVIFDRTSDKINTFINTGSEYEYDPKYEHFFPNDIVNWVVFADYDCDGKKDLFTYTGLGIRIFRNTSSNEFLTWDLIVNPLLSLGTSSKINLIVNSTDIPAFKDVDGDGDLDVLAFNFSNGAAIEYHQNFSVERTGACGTLDYERVTRKYGDIEECVCNVFTFNGDPCPDSGRQLHSGGKTTTLYDADADGDFDLVVGQELCNDVYLIENKGTNTSPLYDSFTNKFPIDIFPLSLFTFPTVFVEDVTFDGLDDIIVAPNLRSNVGGGVDFKNSSRLYQNTGTTTQANFVNFDNDFLQNDMMDLGEYASPTFIDIDGDGDDDLLIGNKGSRNQFGYLSSLAYYRNDTDQFTLVNEDYFELSAYQMTDIKPNFADINNDGRLDMYFTGRNFSNLQLHYLINTSDNNFYTFDLNALNTLSVVLGGSDDPVLSDADLDGDLDLLIARSNGRLSYFDNTGSSQNPVFELKTDTLMGLTFSSDFSNLSIAVGDINSDKKMDLVTGDRSGEVKVYLDYFNNQSQTPQSDLLSLEEVEGLHPTQFGRSSKLAIGTLNNKKTIAIGSIQGGIRLIGTEIGETGNSTGLDVKAFPVPTKRDKKIWLQTTDANVYFEIYNISGSIIVGKTALDQFNRKQINLSSFKTGIYLIRFQNEFHTKTIRITLGDNLD